MGKHHDSLNPLLIAAAGLSERQVQCLELRLAGASYGFIGRQLGIRRHVAFEHCQKATERIAAAVDAGYSEHKLMVA